MFLTHHSGCGFAIIFPNGWLVSVFWGEGSYSSNYDSHVMMPTELSGDSWTAACVKLGEAGAEVVEIAVKNPEGEIVDMDGYEGDPEGYCTPAKFVALLTYAAMQPAKA